MPDTAQAEEATRALLAKLWQRSLPLLRERLNLLDLAATSAHSGTLTDDLRHEACNAAHKLAGSLGMFGYPRGTDIARQLELVFDNAEPSATELITLTHNLRAELAGAL